MAQNAQKSKKSDGLEFLEKQGIKYENIEIKPLEIVKIPDLSSYKDEVLKEQESALGFIKQGNFKAAAEAYQKIFSKNKKDLQTGNILAAILVHNGEYVQAAKVLRGILRDHPSDIIALNNLASNQIRQFDYTSKTEKLLVKALQNAPNVAEIHHNSGVFYHRQSKLQEALKGYLNAKKLKGFPETLIGLGFISLETNKEEDAEKFFIGAINLNKAQHQAYYGLSKLESIREHPENAISLMAQALNLSPENYTYIKGFADLARNNLTIIAKPVFKQAIINYLSYQRLFVQDIFRLWINWLNKDPDFNAFTKLIFIKDEVPENEWPEIFEDINREFFWRGIKEFGMNNILIEDALIKIRRKILLEFSKINTLPENFIYAQAELCFFNEYIYELEEDEEQCLKDLIDQIKENKVKNPKECALKIALIGAYEPLHQSEIIEQAFNLEKDVNDPRYTHLLTFQIREPQEEKRIKRSVKTFGPIKNEISKKVQAQYEENPYPRWKYLSDHSEDIKLLLAQSEVKERKKAEVLIAGCGTGHEAVHFLRANKNINITAVDVSSSSIAYAKRKTDELGFKNITYFQGDILELKELNKKFDHIICSGVLHHMEDPMKGWKVLVEILKPGGKMNIALYSELARQSIVQMRSIISKEGFEPNLEDMRKFRRLIKLEAMQPIFNQLLEWNDFFSTSMLRDMAFNIQEYRFTLPQIEVMLDKLGLKFLEFSKNSSGHAEFQTMQRNLEKRSSLQCWNALEEQYSDMFIGMYNFTCLKI